MRRIDAYEFQSKISLIRAGHQFVLTNKNRCKVRNEGADGRGEREETVSGFVVSQTLRLEFVFPF